MKLAFCLYKYFPYGGLQRDFLRIAKICQQRGHEIHVFTMQWEGNLEPDFHLHLLAGEGWQNHTRCQSFVKKLQLELAKNQYDAVIGFNKMPHLDVYYAADVCYQARMRTRRFIQRLSPRYRRLVALEKAIFARGKSTKILLISPSQQQEFIHCYQTEPERFQLLPPGIEKDRMAPPNADEIRTKVRERYGLSSDHHLLLQVGSGFVTKGLDRTIKGLAALPDYLRERSQLLVIGQDHPDLFIKLAKRLRVSERIHFLGGRSDVPDFLLAADLLVHPAYHENTGTVLLEAIVSGLPVLTTDCCGYAYYVAQANAGVAMRSPFNQAVFNSTLEKMLLSPNRQQWKQNGLIFAQHADIYDMPNKAADIIERVAT